MLWHHPWGELCHSVETFTDSLVKGMTIVWPGVVGEEGGLGGGGGENGGSITITLLSIAFFMLFPGSSLLGICQNKIHWDNSCGRIPAGPLALGAAWQPVTHVQHVLVWYELIRICLASTRAHTLCTADNQVFVPTANKNTPQPQVRTVRVWTVNKNTPQGRQMMGWRLGVVSCHVRDVCSYWRRGYLLRNLLQYGTSAYLINSVLHSVSPCPYITLLKSSFCAQFYAHNRSKNIHTHHYSHYNLLSLYWGDKYLILRIFVSPKFPFTPKIA